MKKHKEAHSMGQKYGMGEFTGSGIRAKIGKIRSMYAPGENPPTPKKLKKPPRTLA